MTCCIDNSDMDEAEFMLLCLKHATARARLVETVSPLKWLHFSNLLRIFPLGWNH